MKRDIVIKNLKVVSVAILTFALLDFLVDGEVARWPLFFLFFLFFPTRVFWEHYRYWRRHQKNKEDG
ncbi:MAG: hypothetical protein U5L04_10460 [Trueperaceae bacterium]|nr:hypothetical protein [Trueperaceae bacterium]